MRRALGVFTLTLGLSACGGTMTRRGGPPEAPPSGPSGDLAPAEESAGAEPRFDDAEAAAPRGETERGALSRQDAPAPESRPGLGTSWGESRWSSVRSVEFVREHRGFPGATAELFYNDASGVRAMTGRSFAGLESNVVSVAEGAFSVQLLDGGGDPLPAVRRGGRTYFVGENGQRYQIRIDNHTSLRVEIVATVDGLDVINGEPGDFSNRGYILHGYDSLDIEGFRRSDDEVAAFRFGAVQDAYASRRGMARNIGVIGVAFFQERGTDWDWTRSEVRRRQTADPFPGRYAPPPPWR